MEFKVFISEQFDSSKELLKKLSKVEGLVARPFKSFGRALKSSAQTSLLFVLTAEEFKRLTQSPSVATLENYHHLFLIFFDPSENLDQLIVKYAFNCEFYPHSLLSRLPEIVQAKKRYLQKLREKIDQDRFKIIVQNMPVMVDAFDENTNFIFWNKECEKVTGYTAEEMVNNPRALEMLYPDENYRAELLKEYARKGNHFRNWEMKLTTKSGEEKIIAWSNLADIYQVPGWHSWAVGIDMTSRYHLEQELKASDFALNTLLEVSQILHEWQTEEQICEQVLMKIRDFLPFKGSLIFLYDYPKQVAELIAAKFENQMFYKSEKVVPLKQLINLELVKNGQIVYLSDVSIYKEKVPIVKTILKLGLNYGFIVPLLFENRVVGSMTFFFDRPYRPESSFERLLKAIGRKLVFTIKQKRLIFELQEKVIELENSRLFQMSELKKSEARLRAQFESLPIPTMIWQKQGNDFILVDYNDMAMASSFGKISEYLGKTSSTVYHFLPQLTELLEECYTNEISLETQIKINVSDDHTSFLSVKLAYVPPDSVVMHFEDITEQKDIELKLTRAKMLIDKYATTLNVLKEDMALLKENLLPTIVEYVEQLWNYREKIKEPMLKHLVTQTHDNLQNCLQVFKSYFAIHPDDVSLQHVALERLVDQLKHDLNPLLSQSNVQILTYIEASALRTDERLLRKALEVLWRLSISRRHPERTHIIRLIATGQNDQVTIVCKDNGKGLSESEVNLLKRQINLPLNKVNDSYYQVLLVQKIARILSAQFEIESVPEEGCQFTFTFKTT